MKTVTMQTFENGPQEVHRPWVKNYYARGMAMNTSAWLNSREGVRLRKPRPERPKCCLDHHTGADITEKDRNTKGRENEGMTLMSEQVSLGRPKSL